MGAVAPGVIVMIGTAIMLAVIIGGIGGVINGRFKRNLLLGTVILGFTYVSSAYLIGFWPVVMAGFLPLILTFILSSTAVNYLKENKKLHPILSISAGLGVAIVIGASYIWLVRTGLFPFKSSVWLAAGIFGCLVIYYAYKSKCASK